MKENESYSLRGLGRERVAERMETLMKNYNEEIFADRLRSFLFGAVEYVKNQPDTLAGIHGCDSYELTADSFSQELGELISDMYCATVEKDGDALNIRFYDGKVFRIAVQSFPAMSIQN